MFTRTIALVAAVAASTAWAQSCAPLSSSPALSTPSTDYCGISRLVLPFSEVFVPAGETIGDLDTAFDATQITSFLALGPPDACYTAAVFYACPGIYQNCTTTPSVGGVQVCQSACNAFLSSCSSFVDSLSASIQSVVRSSLPSCADLPTTGCIDLSVYYASLNDTHFALRPGSGSSGSGPAPSACPAPLLPNPFEANDTYPHNCFGACCIACPLTPSFYPVGWIDQVNTMSAVLMVVSWVVCVFTVASYTYLPNKQHYPADIIRNIAIALLVFYSSNFFSFGPYGRFAWQCEDYPSNPIDLSLPGYTANSLVRAQGAFVVYGILSAVAWYGLLVLSIFMSVVFMSTRLGEYPKTYNVVVWSICWIPIIIGLACNQFGYLGMGTVAALDNGFWMDGLLMYPLALIIFPSVVLNFITLARIGYIGSIHKASMWSIVRLQLRPFTFVMSVLFCFLVYWIHYEVAQRTTPSDAFVPSWMECLATNSQDDCYYAIAINHVPSFGAYALGEFVVSSVAVLLFIFFSGRKDVVLGWYYLLKEGKNSSYFTSVPSASSLRAVKSNRDSLSTQDSERGNNTPKMATLELNEIDKTIASLQISSTSSSSHSPSTSLAINQVANDANSTEPNESPVVVVTVVEP